MKEEDTHEHKKDTIIPSVFLRDHESTPSPAIEKTTEPGHQKGNRKGYKG